MISDFHALATDFESRFLEGVSDSWSDEEFSECALGAFRHQYASCAPYRALCDQRGVTPDRVGDWEEIPAVPATAFKYFDFVSAPSGEPEAVFQTSGTTRGAGVRGRHVVPRLSLYRASLLEPFRSALLPDVERIRFLSLVPDPAEVPDSSLSFMVGAAADEFATACDWLVDAEGRWSSGVEASVQAMRAASEPVLILGTALAFVHLLEREDDLLVALPEGSRVMETGGFKGARRSVPRAELYDGISSRVGVPVERIVNEYGMTELLSQMYEPVFEEGPAAQGQHVAPPWLRVRALDPNTLECVPEGEEGILAFFDLANLGSLCHVLTEDIGSVEDGRLRLRGRAAGSEPRGCSRAMDDLMLAARQKTPSPS
jgi:hypothetical protein